jgi:hypothetical protein
LKRLVKEVVELGKVANEKLKDGYQWMDLLAIGMEGKDLSFVFTNWTSVREQFDDLSTAEIKELVDELVTELGFTDEEVLDLIETSVAFAESGYNLFIAIKALKK